MGAGSVTYTPMGGYTRTPFTGFIRWCEQCGYGLGARPHGKAGTVEIDRTEQRIRQLEAAARTLGYGDCLLSIPYGGKAKIRDECDGLSDGIFTRTWRVADAQNRLRVANKEKYFA
jgi:hypothetical protein